MAEVVNLWDQLNRRFPPNEYALMCEVRDAAGFSASRSADYIAVNLWPSRGLAINGIELKQSRNDWQRELKQPQKAESIFRFCDYFWLLTTDTDIAKIEEIPDTWGWMVATGTRIVTKKAAPKLKPVPVDRDFVCSMLKRACDRTGFVHIDDIADRIKQAKDEGREEGKRIVERWENSRSEAAATIKRFREKSGINIEDEWRYAEIGAAVRMLVDGGSPAELIASLKKLEGSAVAIHKRVSETLAAIEHLERKEALNA